MSTLRSHSNASLRLCSVLMTLVTDLIKLGGIFPVSLSSRDRIGQFETDVEGSNPNSLSRACISSYTLMRAWSILFSSRIL